MSLTLTAFAIIFAVWLVFFAITFALMIKVGGPRSMWLGPAWRWLTAPDPRHAGKKLIDPTRRRDDPLNELFDLFDEALDRRDAMIDQRSSRATLQ